MPRARVPASLLPANSYSKGALESLQGPVDYPSVEPQGYSPGEVGNKSFLRTPCQRDHAKLFHQPQVVAISPLLDDFANKQAKDVNPGPCYQPHFGREPLKFTLMGTSERHTGDHLVAFRHQVFNGHPNVGEGSANHAEESFYGLRAKRVLWQSWYVELRIGSVKLVGQRHVSVVKDLLVKTADNGLILL